MNFTHKTQPQTKMELSDYIQALEAERLKIQVFSKELPLSLELVTQAIEACRLQLSGTTTTSEYNLNGQSESSGQTSSEGPVLEFIPMKRRAPSDCGEDDEDEQHSHKPKIAKDKETDKRKSDWLRSVQLWSPPSPVKEEVPKKASVLEVKRNGGAFQPFHKEPSIGKANALTGNEPSSPLPPPTAVAAARGLPESNKKEEQEGQTQRKQRRCWSQELHKRFLHALQQLGGADSATPKQIRELMKVDGLTNDEVKSHLQKYRLHTRRPSSMIQNNGSSQTAPFVLVGNIIVQPPEYASRAPGDAPPSGIYAPVASHAAAVPRVPVPAKAQCRQSEHWQDSNSEERGNHSEVADHSNSPTSSSSTHTTTASLGYSI